MAELFAKEFAETIGKAFQDGIEEAKNSLKACGCAGCAFESVEEWEMPCSICKRACKDYWRAKANHADQ